MNRRGMSTMVTMLIIILLVLAAVAILWAPIKKMLSSTEGSADQTKCMALDFSAGAKGGLDGDNYWVKISRKDSQKDPIGVKISFSNETGDSSNLEDSGETLGQLGRASFAMSNTLVSNATLMQIIPYFIDEETGDEKFCSPEEIEITPREYGIF
jgi:hypothetical protein